MHTHIERERERETRRETQRDWPGKLMILRAPWPSIGTWSRLGSCINGRSDSTACLNALNISVLEPRAGERKQGKEVRKTERQKDKRRREFPKPTPRFTSQIPNMKTLGILAFFIAAAVAIPAEANTLVSSYTLERKTTRKEGKKKLPPFFLGSLANRVHPTRNVDASAAGNTATPLPFVAAPDCSAAATARRDDASSAGHTRPTRFVFEGQGCAFLKPSPMYVLL